MINRPFRFAIGLLIIFFLFFNLTKLLYILTVLIFIEGFGKWPISNFILQLLKKRSYDESRYAVASRSGRSINFGAERAAILVVGMSLAMVYILPVLHILSADSMILSMLGFLPWAFGFAVLATSFANACPLVIALKSFGFK